MPTQDARIFRLKAEYRRCGIYVLVGAVLCLIVAISLVPMVQQFQPQAPGRGEWALIFGLFIVAATVFWLILGHWRLRVDHQGIARRRFWRWYVWPWEAFRSGAIKQGRTLGYYLWPEAAWTWRGLLLELLDESDREEVDTLIKNLWIAPPEAELPEEVAFRILRTKVHLQAGGIKVRRGRTERHYTWKDIDRIVITRLEHDRRDFTRLKIELGEKPLELFVHQGNPNWRGAEADIIARWFTTHAPEDRILEVSLTGKPSSKAEAEYRLTAARQATRKARICKGCLIGLALALLGFGLVIRKVLIAGAMYSLLSYAYWRMFHEYQTKSEKEERELLDWLSSQEDQRDDLSVA